ncbi:MAG: CoA ester lyase [Deltaproteobacteria bacterium]|nr:MAG: CoA ester lyase [Deltaproteobacteria bacterium]
MGQEGHRRHGRRHRCGDDRRQDAGRRHLQAVSGHGRGEPRKLERAREAGADTVIFDLEDAVAPPRKAEARRHVAAALRAGGFGVTEAAVRINAPGTAECDADLEAVVESGGRTIMVPKAERVEEITRVVETLQRLERGRAGEPGSKLLLLVESPLGVAQALAIGRCAPGIEALCFGHADFALQLGLPDADPSRGIIYHARCALVLAAKACGLAPIDTVHLAVKDEAGFREDAARGLHLGFEGKLCIHPRQVEIANAVFTPGPAQIEYARRVIAAWEDARASERGVFTLDGKMIDAPLVAVQRRVLERARRAGALPDTSEA